MRASLCPHGQIVAPDALKAKYPRACHAPLSDCHRCQGTGERWQEKREFVKEGWRPCLCLFIGQADIPLVADVIKTVVERETRKHRNAPDSH